MLVSLELEPGRSSSNSNLSLRWWSLLVVVYVERTISTCFLGGRFLGWNRMGFRRNYAYAEQVQQREHGRGAGGDQIGVAATGGLRPVMGTDVSFRPREKR